MRMRTKAALAVLAIVVTGALSGVAAACPGGPGGAGGVNVMSAAATYLGMTTDQLRTELKSGKTLAQLATAAGKTVAGLKQAIASAAKTQLDKAVAAGTITSAQEQTILDNLNANLDAIVNGTKPSFAGSKAASFAGFGGFAFRR